MLGIKLVSRSATLLAAFLGFFHAFAAPARAQEAAAKASAAAGETLESINQQYERDIAEVELKRIERLHALAASQELKEADATLQTIFEYALAVQMYEKVQPLAREVAKRDGTNPNTLYLAIVIDMLADIEKGNYRESVETLEKALLKANEPGKAEEIRLPLDTRLTLVELIFQNLAKNDQLEVAREAFTLISKSAKEPAVQEYAASRLKRLEMVGKPAPVIAGTDLDGKALDSAALKGKPVLVVFWASWCLPNATEIDQFQELLQPLKQEGLAVLGVNLDTAQEDGLSNEEVLPAVRRFLLDHNVSWPTIINGKGDQDYASRFGVTDIPANVLIGKDGTIHHLDLDREHLAAAVREELAK